VLRVQFSIVVSILDNAFVKTKKFGFAVAKTFAIFSTSRRLGVFPYFKNKFDTAIVCLSWIQLWL
jgi:hypothetical protein